MTEKGLVSIIIPVYNAAKCIPDTIESVKSQTCKDWELILVDDGSPDGSGAICDRYAASDQRIKVYHKENGGVSSARNMGLDNATGEWICFVDADDEISERTLEECMGREEDDIDVIQFSFSQRREELNRETDDDITPMTWQEYIGKRSFLVCVGGSVIRSRVIRENAIRFDETMKLAEDQIFMFTCFAHSRRVARVNRILYYYYDNGGSATHNEKAEDMILSSQKCIAFKQQYPDFSFRMDDLVLFFIEKLILQGRYEDCKKLLAELRPTYIIKRGVVTRTMVRLSRKNVNMAINFERLCYPLYNRVYRIYEKINKNK